MKFTKVVSIALTSVIGLSLIAGCNDQSANGTTLSLQTAATSAMTSQTTVAEGVEGYVFTYKGTDVRVNTDMNKILSSLGDDYSYFEAASCAGLGMSKTYTYGGGSVVISTNPNGDVDVISSIALYDDTVQTPEGIYIGCTRDQVNAAYGTSEDATDTTSSYQLNDTMLVFVFNGDGKVTNIIYNGVV